VGRGAFGWLGDAGRMAIFFRDAATRVHRRPFRLLELITQLEFVGARSVTVVALSAAAPPPGR
jgi:ABC-type transporter Mla maintaining outer membrane lipid asymmetry permease subunit MlaE